MAECSFVGLQHGGIVAMCVRMLHGWLSVCGLVALWSCSFVFVRTSHDVVHVGSECGLESMCSCIIVCLSLLIALCCEMPMTMECNKTDNDACALCSCYLL